MRGVGKTLPRLVSEQSSPISIFDLQAKLNFSWFGRVGDRTESAGKVLARLIASRSAERNKWAVQASVESARCLEDVSVEDMEKICFEVDRGPLSKNPGFLAKREVLIPYPPCAGMSEGSWFVTESQRSYRRERRRVVERRSGRIKIRALVCLTHSRDIIYSGNPSEVTPGKQNIARRATARAVCRRRSSGLVGSDG